MTRRSGVGYVQLPGRDRLLRREDNMALWEFGSRSGYGVYLYRDVNWFERDPDGPWLLYAKRRDLKEADEVFAAVCRLFLRR